MINMNLAKLNSKNLGKTLFLIGIIGLIYTTIVGLIIPAVWSDEIFSLVISQFPISKFISVIFRDVHPPLYYLILRGIMEFLSLFGVSAFVSGTIASLIPFYLLILFGYKKIRKDFGWLTLGIFTFAIIFMPKFMLYAVEIRMYGWAMFFVTMTFIYMYEVIKKSSIHNWALLTFFSACAAYTHYYAAFSAAVIYVMLLAYIIFKNKALIKPYIISAVICVVSYIPWIFVLKNQVTRRAGFWIEPIGKKTIISYLYYVFSPTDVYIIQNGLIKPTILGSLLILAVLVLLVYCLKKRSEKNIKYAYLGILVAIIVPIIGIVISFIKYPLIHYRYLFPPLGCFWLGFSILLANLKNNKKIFIPIMVIMLVVGAVAAVELVDLKNDTLAQDQAYNQTLHQIFPENSVIIFDAETDWFLTSYFINDTCYVIHTTPTQEDVYKLKEEYNASGVYYIQDYTDYIYTSDLNKTQIYSRVDDPNGIALNLFNTFKLA